MKNTSPQTTNHTTGPDSMTDFTRTKLSRRLALLLPLAATGCETVKDIFVDPPKPPIPGTRIDVLPPTRGVAVDNPRGVKVRLPQPTPRADWPQPGGSPSHEVGHAQVADQLQEAWTANVGRSAGYRRKIPAPPVVLEGRALTMDPDGLVRAFDMQTGNRIWEFDTTPEDDDNTNVGGGVSAAPGLVYAATGRAELIALEAATGKQVWRVAMPQPARAAPTVADGRLFVPLLGNSIVAFDAKTGSRIWSYQGTASVTGMLGLPAPAYADGLLVAGLGSGELVALRAATGAVVWLDNLGTAHGGDRDLSAVLGLPVIQDGRVYAASLGGLMVAIDLRSGRRLWERDITSGNTPCVAGGFIFVLTTDAQVVALDRIDGSIIWLTQLEKWGNKEKQRDPIFWSGPLLAGDRLVVVSGLGTAQAISPYTGEILGEQKLSGPAAVPPVVASGTLLVITDDAKLQALR